MAKKQNPVESTIVEATTAPVESTIVEATTTIQPTMKVGQRARELILKGELDNKGILEVLKKEYPEGKTSMACVAWYKSDVKKSKPVDGYQQWLKANELELRAKYEASLVVEA